MRNTHDLSYIARNSYILADFLDDLIKLSGECTLRVKDVIAEVECLIRKSECAAKELGKPPIDANEREHCNLLKLYISQKEAAFRYGFSRQWFEHKRWAGGGPSFLKIGGKVLYNLIDTDAWFASHGKRHNTSEYINGA